MKDRTPSIGACLVILISCLAWIGFLTLALFHFLDLSPLAGWIVAIVMGSSAILAATAILYEIRHAIDLKNHLDPVEAADVLYWKSRAKLSTVAGNH